VSKLLSAPFSDLFAAPFVNCYCSLCRAAPSRGLLFRGLLMLFSLPLIRGTLVK
jgi:hypothetical protein